MAGFLRQRLFKDSDASPRSKNNAVNTLLNAVMMMGIAVMRNFAANTSAELAASSVMTLANHITVTFFWSRLIISSFLPLYSTESLARNQPELPPRPQCWEPLPDDPQTCCYSFTEECHDSADCFDNEICCERPCGTKCVPRDQLGQRPSKYDVNLDEGLVLDQKLQPEDVDENSLFQHEPDGKGGNSLFSNL